MFGWVDKVNFSWNLCYRNGIKTKETDLFLINLFVTNWISDPARIQTWNLLIRSQVLYSVKLRGHKLGCKYKGFAQIRKASNSVSLNISEGSARTTKMYVNQLIIAKGSATEVLSGSILAVRLGYMEEQDLLRIRGTVGEVKKMLHSLISSIENKN